MNAETAQRKTPRRRWLKPVAVTLFLAAVAAFVWQQLPSGAYPTDLSRIGQGRPAVVLAYDSNFSGGMSVMALMNEIRADHEPRVDFLVAHLGMADAREFAQRHGVVDGTVLLFAGDGRRVDALHPQSAEQLREAIARAFGS